MGFRYNESVHNRGPVPPQQRRGSLAAVGAALLLVLLLVVGCSWLKRHDGLIGVAPIHLNPTLRLSPALTNATVAYQNACGKPASIPIGGPLTEAVRKKLGRVFTSVVLDPSQGPAGRADGTIDMDLGIKQVDLAIYRQVKRSYPVTVTLGLDASFLADDGTVLSRHKVQSAGHGDVDATDTSCDVKGLEAVVLEASEIVAEGMARQLANSVRIREYAGSRPIGRSTGPVIPAPATGPEPAPALPVAAPVEKAVLPEAVPDPGRGGSTVAEPPAQAAGLTFRAIVRDENRDQILQQEESLTIEIEVKNDSLAEARGVEVVVGGTSALVAQLPQTIPVGDLQPGEVKRASATKSIVAIKEPLRGEIVLTLRAASASGQIPPAKKVMVPFRPGKSEDSETEADIDQPPKPFTAVKPSRALVVSIGIGRFRDDQVPVVKYAARDAEVMASYLKAIGGIPDDRIRVLIDTHALKQDLADAFEDWLGKRVDATTVVYVFFSGRALVDGVTGAASLMPFDGTVSAVGRLYSVRRLQDALAKLPIQRAILMFDVSLDPAPGADPGAGPPVVWDSGTGGKKDQVMWMVGNRRLQEAHAYERGRHGLFTYYLLKGLQGAADVDRDGTVAAGELCTYAGGRVSQAARELFGNEQDPLCLPPAGQGALVRIQPLAKGNNPKPAPPVKKSEPALSIPESQSQPNPGTGP